MSAYAYYNENDRFKAAWLRELIAEGLIAPGDVDQRSIEDVCPGDLARYSQCHFFAGIGGWSYALRLAGWPDGRPIWTGSAPCQPFSAAGQGAGFVDKRHLWPAFYWLIRQCRPQVIFGEQVSSPLGIRWWDAVATDLENASYACAAFDLPAASVGAYHRRHRLYWVADSQGKRLSRRPTRTEQTGVTHAEFAGMGVGHVAHLPAERHDFWSRAEWVVCPDGEIRAIESGIQPVANGLPGRVGMLRGAGDAIVPQLAAEFIACYIQARHLGGESLSWDKDGIF